jgi:hypothetical protein
MEAHAAVLEDLRALHSKIRDTRLEDLRALHSKI